MKRLIPTASMRLSAAAKRIATVFYMFKGDTIKQAQRRFAQLGGEGQARINTFKQLNIPLWEEDTMFAGTSVERKIKQLRCQRGFDGNGADVLPLFPRRWVRPGFDR